MIPKKIHYCWFGGNKKPKSVIKCIESKIDEHGLRQYYDLIEEYNFGNAVLKEIHLYFDHPSLFIFKYRSKANIHGIIKRVLPKKVLASIKKRFMER